MAQAWHNLPVDFARAHELVAAFLREAMKVHAMKHAPERTWQEMLDIAHLVTLPGVDRPMAKKFFDEAGLGARWEELARGF